MKVFLALVVPLFCAATLFAEPEGAEEPSVVLGLSEAFVVGEDQADVLVEALAQEAPPQVRVGATFLRVAAAEAEAVLGAHRPDALGSVRPIPLALARRLIGSAQGHGAIRAEPLPPLVLYDGQCGRLSATGHHTYLQDYDVEVGDHHFAYVPLVGKMTDGARLDVTPRHHGGRISFDVEAVWAEAARPIPRFDATLPHREEGVTIELPELRLRLRKAYRESRARLAGEEVPAGAMDVAVLGVEEELRSAPPGSAEALRRQAWARLLKKVFEVEPLVCPRCRREGLTVEMEIVAWITDLAVVDRILTHRRERGLKSVFDTPPARAPPAA